MILKNILLLGLLCFSFLGFSQEWHQNTNKTKVVFTIKNFGINVEGSFNKVKIYTNFKEKELTKSYINAEILVKSIATGIQNRDQHLLKQAYFDNEKHPTIHLKSTKIEKNIDDTFSLFADLKLKGVTKKIKVPLSVFKTDKSLTIASNFIINRKDFKINGGGFVLSNAVKIEVTFVGEK